MHKPKDSNDLNDDDMLGRAVFSKRQKKAGINIKEEMDNNGDNFNPGDLRKRKAAFTDNSSPKNLSMDRLGISDKELVTIQEKASKNRVNCSGFYGWFKLRVKTARQWHTVQLKPTPENAYHAILFNSKNEDIDRHSLTISCEWIGKDELIATAST